MKRIAAAVSVFIGACGPGIPNQVQTDWCAVDPEQTLVNTDCGVCLATLVPSYPDADQTWVVTRLEPTTAPFVVESVGYFASGRPDGCDAGVAHRARVWVEASDAPGRFLPAELAADVELEPVSNRILRPVEIVLPSPARLEAGDALFVAVQLASGDSGGACLRACAARAVGRDWTTLDRTEPFEWTELNETLASPVHIEAFAEGYVDRASATGRARMTAGN